MSSEHEIEYTEGFMDVMEMVWGDGFLSPGGKEEIALFLDGLDINGKDVLDIGSGCGGCDVVLVKDYGAGSVLGIDIEQPLMNRSIARAEREGLSDRISYKLVEPGPFPLADESFDVVFSKDAMIHIEDKHALFADVYRVLRPGGVFVASDWTRRDENDPGPEMQGWLDAVGLTFGMHSMPFYIDALEKAGFQDVSTRDRNDFLVDVLTADYQIFTDSGRSELEKRAGGDAEYYITMWGAAKAAAEVGELRPAHMRGFKPS
ncbi:MAG: methyltransferase domain-containing protein [Pseudomonadota bacterium]